MTEQNILTSNSIPQIQQNMVGSEIQNQLKQLPFQLTGEQIQLAQQMSNLMAQQLTKPMPQQSTQQNLQQLPKPVAQSAPQPMPQQMAQQFTKQVSQQAQNIVKQPSQVETQQKVELPQINIMDPNYYTLFGFSLSKTTIYIIIAFVIVAAIYYIYTQFFASDTKIEKKKPRQPEVSYQDQEQKNKNQTTTEI